MNTTVSGVRPEDAWLRHRDDDAIQSRGPSPAAPRTSPGPSPAPPPLPESTLSRPSPAVAPPPAAVLRDARDVQAQRALDAFRMSLTGWYHTRTGDFAAVTPFLISPGYGVQRKSLANPADQAEMRQAAAKAGLSSAALARVQCGRGTPDEIHRLTQALIDAGPRNKHWNSLKVRELMFTRAIGLDCAGYAQQAYLRATGRTAAQAGFDTITNESLSGLSQRGFRRVEALADVRPGDIIVFHPPPQPKGEPGHRAVVYDQRVATADDMRTLLSTTSGQAFAVGGTVRVLEMDSSYGCDGKYQDGGVQRQTWLYNETTKQWAYEVLKDGEPSVTTAATLYWHPLEGIYRKKGD